MGRRKKAMKKVSKTKRAVLAKSFKCLFCHHDKSVNCKMDNKSMTGALQCTICDAKFQTQINSLSEPIDVFTEWIDEADVIFNKDSNVGADLDDDAKSVEGPPADMRVGFEGDDDE